MTSETPDFVALHRRYESLDNGMKAQLRRVADPDELRDTPTLYRLFPKGRAHDVWLRVAFLLPWCGDCGDERRKTAPRFGKLLAEAKVSEMRVFQVVRATAPFDLIQFRRLAIQLKHPNLDWNSFGWLLFRSDPDGSWRRKSKRQLVEDFCLA